MVGRKRRGSILLMLSMLMVMLCGFGMMNVEVQAEDEVPYGEVVYNYDAQTKTLTVYYSNGCTGPIEDTEETRYDNVNKNTSIAAWKDEIEKIVIKGSITAIGKDAFSFLPNLKTVEIKSGVESICEEAFDHCTSLTTVNIPNTVKVIGNSAFNCCSSLTTITLPEGLKSIGSGVFYGATSLGSITIPSTVTTINENGRYLFAGCCALESVEIKCKMTTIGADMFRE